MRLRKALLCKFLDFQFYREWFITFTKQVFRNSLHWIRGLSNKPLKKAHEFAVKIPNCWYKTRRKRPKHWIKSQEAWCIPVKQSLSLKSPKLCICSHDSICLIDFFFSPSYEDAVAYFMFWRERFMYKMWLHLMSTRITNNIAKSITYFLESDSTSNQSLL